MSVAEPETDVVHSLLWEVVPPGGSAQLKMSRCTACSRAEFPAMDSCPACGELVELISVGPTCRLQGCTEVLHAPPGAKVDVPYTVVVAGFPEVNLAVMGLLERHTASAELDLGTEMEVCVVDYGGGVTYGFRRT